MTTNRTNRGGLKLLGLGALACVGCCAGPVLAVFGGLSVVGLASAAVIGGAGVLIAVAAALAYIVVRRRRTLACDLSYSEPVPVSMSGRPTDSTERAR